MPHKHKHLSCPLTPHTHTASSPPFPCPSPPSPRPPRLHRPPAGLVLHPCPRQCPGRQCQPRLALALGRLGPRREHGPEQRQPPGPPASRPFTQAQVRQPHHLTPPSPPVTDHHTATCACCPTLRAGLSTSTGRVPLLRRLTHQSRRAWACVLAASSSASRGWTSVPGPWAPSAPSRYRSATRCHRRSSSSSR